MILASRLPSRCLLLIWLMVASAQSVLAQPAPVDPVAALDDGLIKIMQAGRATPFAERMRILTPVVQASFDLELILRNSIGPRYAGFAAPQKAALLDSFTEFTVASYVANFDSFSGERFDILPTLRPAGADTVVPTRLISGGAEAAKLDYVVHPSPAGYLIADVLLDGSISRVAVQRSDFRSLVASGVPAPLIAMLRGRVASLAAGERK